MRRALILVLAGCVSGCATELRDIGQAPHLTPVGSGLQPARIADVDGNGLADRAFGTGEAWVDTDGDGRWDIRLADDDGDGGADSAEYL